MLYRIICHKHIFAPGIPEFLQCHASTLTLLPGDGIAAAWFAGDHEKAPNVGIWFSRCTADRNWTYPVKIADGDGVPCWNPVLYYDGKLLLFYKVGQEIPRWQTFIRESCDYGLSWSPAAELVPGDYGGRGPVKNKCIRLKDGALLAPSSIEGEYWDCFTDRSEDGGKTWENSPYVPLNHSGLQGRGIIQPSLWEDEAGAVHMFTRSSEGVIMKSVSRDGGRSWSEAQRTALPNNNSGLDAARLEDGRMVLVFNPVSGNWAPRSPIAFAVSEDNGETFGEPQILDYVPCERNEPRAEFSYPAVVTRGNRVFITYTWKRQSIAFWELEF